MTSRKLFIRAVEALDYPENFGFTCCAIERAGFLLKYPRQDAEKFRKVYKKLFEPDPNYTGEAWLNGDKTWWKDPDNHKNVRVLMLCFMQAMVDYQKKGYSKWKV